MPDSQPTRRVHPAILARARELRREMTPQERKLWRRLRGKQLCTPLTASFSISFATNTSWQSRLTDIHTTNLANRNTIKRAPTGSRNMASV